MYKVGLTRGFINKQWDRGGCVNELSPRRGALGGGKRRKGDEDAEKIKNSLEQTPTTKRRQPRDRKGPAVAPWVTFWNATCS